MILLRLLDCRNMDELLKGISLIGRSLALWTCLGHICTHLQQSVAELTELQQQAMAVVSQGVCGTVAMVDVKNVTRQMEVQRICCLFLTHLLFEGGERAVLSGDAGVNNSTLLDESALVSSSSDIMLVPRFIVDPLDCHLQLLPNDGASGGGGPDMEAFTTSVRQFRHAVVQLLPLCAASVELQHQALLVTKQFREQLRARQITSGEDL